MDSWPQPRTKQRTRNLPYIFRITDDYVYEEAGWDLAEAFDCEWLHISVDGVITVKANEQGYAWDGCTPKWSLLNLAIIGVPDGHVNHRTMQPYTYAASLVHDALYQYLDTVPVSKAKIDWLFYEMLGDFKLKWVYYQAVKLLGGRGVEQKGLASP
jgi:hypothetical protein